MVVVTQYLKYRFLLNKVIIVDVIIFSLLIKIFRFLVAEEVQTKIETGVRTEDIMIDLRLTTNQAFTCYLADRAV